VGLVLEFEIWRLKAITDPIYWGKFGLLIILVKAELALWDEPNVELNLFARNL
jgi:hypothetical protein